MAPEFAALAYALKMHRFRTSLEHYCVLPPLAGDLQIYKPMSSSIIVQNRPASKSNAIRAPKASEKPKQVSEKNEIRIMAAPAARCGNLQKVRRGQPLFNSSY
jgi:hypothetical protein